MCRCESGVYLAKAEHTSFHPDMQICAGFADKAVHEASSSPETFTLWKPKEKELKLNKKEHFNILNTLFTIVEKYKEN